MKSVGKTKMPGALVSCAMILFLFFFAADGFANVYVPNTFTDPVISSLNTANGAINGGATISLRSALMAADNLGGTHTITLSTGTYNLSKSPFSEITIGNTPQNITINGNGPANTIINMVNDAFKDRILFINPAGTTNSPVITVNGIKFQNAYLSSDPYGGAAICSGGGAAESLTVTNCAFENNTLPANAYGGAAICTQVRGNLTIDNCTFTNNVSNDADGGAVLFILFGTNLGTAYGTLNVTNSTFTGNSVIFPGAGASNGGALAFTAQAGTTPYNVTVNNNTFTNNTADGYGGAISANNSANTSILQVHFNRFVNNTSATNAITSGMLFVNSAGSVNAENNWWGCNSNPVNGASTAPCNQANGIGASGGGIFDADPWLQLKVTASPTTICNGTPSGLGNTSSITASFLNNSSGTLLTLANISRLIGLPVTWGPATLGSLSAQQTTIQANGTATALFTSNGTGGTANINAEVDNVPNNETSPARASIIVNTIPIVTLNPLTQSKCDPSSVTFIAAATGSPTPTVQWQVSTDNGMNFNNIPGATSTSYTFTAVFADNQKQYRAVFTNVCSTATTTAAILTVFPIEYPQFAYNKDAYCQMGTEDPLPIIYGTPGGIFSATAGLSINTATGMIDVSASSVGGPYTITYNTNGPCPKTATFPVSIVNCIPTATLTDAIIIDNGTSGLADPNDRIRLTATIGNAQVADYNAMQLILNDDPRVTLVPGSFKSTPLAVNDLYATTLNTMLTVPIGTGLLANDFDNNIPGLSVTTFPVTSTQGGTIAGNANGSFTYTPPNGFTGNDTFTYVITDSDAQTNSGTVKIHVQ